GGRRGLPEHDPLLEPGLTPLEHRTRHPVLAHIVIAPYAPEMGRDAPARAAAEQVRQRDGLTSFRTASTREAVGTREARGHGEQLRTDVHGTKQQRLLLLQLSLVDQHGMEERSRQLAARAVDVADMAGQRAELAVARPPAPAEPPAR